MSVQTARFVYGELSPVALGQYLGRATSGEQPEFAIEILREYSANELVGKLYRKRYLGDWVPVDPSVLESPEWRQRSTRRIAPFSSLRNRLPATFEMAGSGKWKVLHLRIESDETGPYVAIALRHSE